MTDGRWTAAPPWRAGAVSALAVAGFWWVVARRFSGDACRSTQANQFGCLGAELVTVAIGIAVLWVVTVCLLAGKGLWHAVAGATVALAAGWWLTSLALRAVGFTDSDVLGLVLTGPVTGALVFVWAVLVPDSRTRRDRD